MPLVEAELRVKHDEMRSSKFSFLRATYYRWAQLFVKVCEGEEKAPEVLSVGDLHVENFGTWRDAEGRLVWGINDFDEATRIPFTNDLIRLAASVKVAAEAGHLSLEFEPACEAVVSGYRKGLKGERSPFVLAENHQWLRDLASGEIRDPVHFWDKMSNLTPFGSDARKSGVSALKQALPSKDIRFEPLARQAGLGSLGRHRYVAVAEWNGGLIAREAKRLCPSAAAWAEDDGDAEILYSAILKGAVRCPDPSVEVQGDWITRRLAPDCSRIELASLPKERDELRLVEAMGRETANVHGSRDASAILKNLDNRPKHWLAEATHKMVKQLDEDFAEWAQAS